MANLGPLEIGMILIVIVLLFGAGRIADVGKGLGQGIKNFKQGLREVAEDDDAAKDEVSKKEAAKKATAKEKAAEEA
jgi:sec-independent protein translocase protein TatA